MKEFKKDNLKVKIFKTRIEMGAAAGKESAEYIRNLLANKDEVNILFGAAPSQDEVLEAFINEPGIDWSRINAFHMDEYIGLEEDAVQGFGNYLRSRVFNRKPFKSVNYINKSGLTPEQICKRYEELLRQMPIDFVFMGIGENGHIAFNDPHVAFFDDPKMVKEVDLDMKCRIQQVNDGCFPRVEDVPTHAITLTIPALVAPARICCVVPAIKKATAVRDTILGEISESCPASILRRHDNATLYLDSDSASML